MGGAVQPQAQMSECISRSQSGQFATSAGSKDLKGNYESARRNE